MKHIVLAATAPLLVPLQTLAQAADPAQLVPVHCAAAPGSRTHCPADTSAGILLTRSTGDSACLLGKTWGYDDAGVWVLDGCAADFLVSAASTRTMATQAPPPAPEPATTLAALPASPPPVPATKTGTPETSPGSGTDALTGTVSPQPEAAPTVHDEPEYFGEFQPGGRGYRVANTRYGDLNISLYSYARYLNQDGLDDGYTDYFGRDYTLDKRNDLQFQKVTLYFKGWVGDPQLRYLAYVWSSNTSQGQSAQVVVAGNLTYAFQPAFNLGVGINALPTTRSTEGNWPNWLRVDNRTIADEYFRGSFTTGLFAFGNLGDSLNYNLMLGNNLSQLGIDAAQLDGTLNTISGALVWKPQGTYQNGFGDFEHSPDLLTRLGFHLTDSTEDAQTQPATDDPENSQIRLSDGTRLFQPGAFNTDGQVTRAHYLMSSVDAGIKYRGWALEGEYYYRWVDDFRTLGYVPVDELEDHGFQLQASVMLVPNAWQLYLSGSKIFGEYGDPWDAGIGLNWFPYASRQFRLNTELLYLDNSPVGYASVPYLVGANGTVYQANAELRF